MSLPDDPLIPSRAERIQLLVRIARGELRDQHVLPNGRIVEVPAPMRVRQRAIATLRKMGVRDLPRLEVPRAH